MGGIKKSILKNKNVSLTDNRLLERPERPVLRYDSQESGEKSKIIDGTESDAWQFVMEDLKSPQSITSRKMNWGNTSRVSFADDIEVDKPRKKKRQKIDYM